MEILRVGTRVRHKSHRHLVGKVAALEYNEARELSPLPYKVYWDNNGEAAKLLGFMFLYPPKDAVEVE